MTTEALYTVMAWFGSVWLFTCIVFSSSISIALLLLKGKEYYNVLKLYERRKVIAMSHIVKDERFWETKHEPAKHDSPVS